MPSLHKEYLTLVPPSVNLQCVFGGSCPSVWQNKMVMSQGTYTFLSCFAGFWLIWGLIVLLCCLCSFLRRRMKRRREERLREQSLRSVHIEPLQYEEYVSSPRIPVAHRIRAQQAAQPPPQQQPAAAQARPWSATRRNGKQEQPMHSYCHNYYMCPKSDSGPNYFYIEWGEISLLSGFYCCL